MAATFLNEITDQMIRDRLHQIGGVRIEWTGRLPRDAESWAEPAHQRLCEIDEDDVREMLERHELAGDTPLDEINMAISIACEPEGMPDNGIVVLIV